MLFIMKRKNERQRTRKDKDEVNRREVCECDGCVCDLEVMDDPSILNIIRKCLLVIMNRESES